jgi:hypothetical protein
MLIPDAVSAEFFHTAAGTAFVDLLINGNRETWPIRSKRFRTWLRRRHYEATRTAANAATVNSALDLFEAQAQFEGPERAVHVRLAEHAGHIYLDLADECWRAVDIGPDGWRVIGSSPVRFRRTAGMLPLPLPQGGGSIEELASFLNLPSRNDFVLVVAWILATLRAGGPYPVLAISGEQGSAKTVLSKLLKALVDPNVAPVRALAREERDLVIAANNSHVLAFDNLSGLPHALSDAFCRLATGASFGLRQLYTDADEVLFQAARPILLNGIEDVISRPDLADRAIFLTLPPIADRRRRSERQIWRDFEAARASILGSLLDAAAHGLRNLPGIYLEQLPRMADFALWTTACETAFWARWHVHTGLSGKPQGRDRGPNRRRSSSRSSAGDHGEPHDMDRKCFGPSAYGCRVGRSQHLEGRPRLAEEPQGTRRPIASRTNFPSHAGHRNDFWPSRTRGNADDYDSHRP